MDNDQKRPSAALINREWFEAAAPLMGEEDLGVVIVNACRYVWGLPEVPMKNQVQRVVFAMIKPALDSDVDKYVERCARNAANAKSQRQRVAASGSDSQRVAANTTTTSTTTSTTTTTTTSSISPEMEVERERWLIFGYFWSTGSKAIKQELDAFWNYYESLGWKNNKGAPIVSKLAAARNWRRQFETGAAPDGSAVWFKAVQNCPTPDANAFTAFVGAQREEAGVVVRLRCKSAFYEALKAAVPDLERSLMSLWRVPQIRFELVS